MTEALELSQPTHGQGWSFEAGMPSAFFATELFAHVSYARYSPISAEGGDRFIVSDGGRYRLREERHPFCLRSKTR